MRIRRRHWFLRRIGLALVVAAVAAPAAQARPLGDSDVSITGSLERSVPASPVRADGFDWADAGTGGAVALGAVLLAAIAARTSRHLGGRRVAGA